MLEDKITNVCTAMRNAMAGAGTDEKTLFENSASLSLKERLKVREAYKSLYGRDLMKDFEDELSGDFRTLIKAIYMDPVEYDAECLYLAMKGLGTTDHVLIEILVSRPGWYLRKVADKFKEVYKKNLEDEVKDETSGTYQKALVSLLQGNRSENQYPDKDECAKIADEIYKAGEGKVGTNEEVFIKYFCSSSPAELAVIAREYHKLSKKKDLMQALDSEFSFNAKKIFQEILYSQISPSEYFATKIKYSIKGLGTKEKDLIRVVVSRCEVDMPIIKKFYKLLYKKELEDEVKNEVSGDFGKLLMLLIAK